MLYGFLNINKPSGITSFDVIRKLRKLSGIKKIGHTGTLDPLAEGVLLVGIGEATKLIEYLVKDKKEYIGGIKLGSVSTTYDSDGEIKEVSNQIPTKEEILEVLKGFEGEIEQVPPVFSALKINGKKAYELARKGEKVELKSRKVTIFRIDLLSYEYPILKVEVKCSSGTYIRSLANDIGEKLRTGAYLNALIRTEVGDLNIEDSVTLREIEEKGFKEFLLPVEDMIKSFNKVLINKEELKKLDFGQFILREDITEDIAAAFFDKKLIGMIERVPGKPNLFKYCKKLNII